MENIPLDATKNQRHFQSAQNGSPGAGLHPSRKRYLTSSRQSFSETHKYHLEIHIREVLVAVSPNINPVAARCTVHRIS